MYASSAWWGFTSAADRQRLDAFIRRSSRSRLVPPDLPEFADLCQLADEKLFREVTVNCNHVLHCLLPPPTKASQQYELRQRRHNFELPTRTNYLMDCNFIQRMLYFNCY